MGPQTREGGKSTPKLQGLGAAKIYIGLKVKDLSCFLDKPQAPSSDVDLNPSPVWSSQAQFKFSPVSTRINSQVLIFKFVRLHMFCNESVYGPPSVEAWEMSQPNSDPFLLPQEVSVAPHIPISLANCFGPLSSLVVSPLSSETKRVQIRN